MKEVSNSIAQDKFTGWSTPSLTVPEDLRSVAKTFVLLQEARHSADYDNVRIWSRLEVREKIAQVKRAFLQWDGIRTHPAANEYLLSLLVGNKRDNPSA